MRLGTSNLKRINQRGLALVIVMWMLVLLTIMAAGYSTTTRTETRLTAQQLYASQARASAEAGLWLVVQDLLKPEPARRWPADGTSNEIIFSDNQMEIIIQDQAGMIDINTARDELLKGLIESTGEDEPAVQQLVDAILDWRDRDDLTRLYGAEDSDYRNSGFDYEAKDGPFNSIDEMRKVMGMTESVYQKIQPALTVYSHLPGINPEVAPAEVLMAVPGMDSETIDNFMMERSNPELTAKNPTVPGLNSRFTNNSKGISYKVTSSCVINETRVTLEAVISLRRNSKLPYTVLSWREI